MAGRIVVVGASLGGLRAAEAVSAAGWSGEVVLVGAEPYLPYNRPPLSKEALIVDPSFELVALRLRRSVHSAKWRLGVAATGVDLRARTLALSDGTRLGWDGLVISTGLRPRRLSLTGRPSAAGRFVLRTLDDAKALRRVLVASARVVIAGAGFIGCEVAAAAVRLGCSVAVVAPEAVPLQRPLGDRFGQVLRELHESQGVRFWLGHRPVGVVEAGSEPSRVSGLVLDDGTVLEADVVVEAVGSQPNVEWLDGSGLDTSDGVLTDASMRAVVDGVPRPDVVAVGDVARFPNVLFDEVPRRVEHWNMPTETGRRAGAVLVAGLAGESQRLDDRPFTPLPAFWSDQYEARVQSFGALELADEIQMVDGDLAGEFVLAYRRGGRLVGVAGVGSMARLLELRAGINAPT